MCRYKEEAYHLMNSDSFDKYSLPDVSSFSFLPAQEQRQKFQQFLSYVKNPYLFRVGDIGVHVSFSGESGESLQRSMLRILSAGF